LAKRHSMASCRDGDTDSDFGNGVHIT
jgi:hypothetical protein